MTLLSLYISTYTYAAYIYVPIYTHIYLYIPTYTYAAIYIPMHIYIYAYATTYIPIPLYICLYIHMPLYICTHIPTYTYAVAHSRWISLALLPADAFTMSVFQGWQHAISGVATHYIRDCNTIYQW